MPKVDVTWWPWSDLRCFTNITTHECQFGLLVIHFLGLTLSEGVVLFPQGASSGRLPAFHLGQKSSALVNTVLLTHPAPQAAIALATDASDMAVWAVLEHHVAGAWQLLTFVLIANYVTMHHFQFLFEGCSFTARVNHNPWIFAMSKVSHVLLESPAELPCSHLWDHGGHSAGGSEHQCC